MKTEKPQFMPPARKYWLLLAHRSKARILTLIEGKISSYQELDHPDGRRLTRELVSDDHGSRNSSGPARHGLDPHEEAAEHVADVFAHNLARIIRTGRSQGSYDDLILVAEPGFLGKIKMCLDADTSKRVIATVNQNWTDLPDERLFPRIHQLMDEKRVVA